ncbi:helix-turn-helix protein [Comamonas sp. BIGb0124]|uniref:hypothetical protein n=1 Tax=Comamonas sp. BIGb0124 TaxID=2485130 RepID=UPI000F478E14|nr:hypothetical protein [Comamonas sp. BIGb0124]ROR21723.1 helix-turn-helix protein [Comamonas sp. BIGb0124]
MKKAPSPTKAELSAVTNNGNSTVTANPRHQRALEALMRGPVTRNSLDAIAGVANGPDIISDLRRCGLEIPCLRLKVEDRDGRTCRPGVYTLTEPDRAVVRKWAERRAA